MVKSACYTFVPPFMTFFPLFSLECLLLIIEENKLLAYLTMLHPFVLRWHHYITLTYTSFLEGFITSDASHTEEEVAQKVVAAAAVVSPTTEWRISKQFI